MPLFFAIVSAVSFALCLMLLAGIVAAALHAPALPALMVIGTSLWTYFDAKKLGLSRYKTGLTSPELTTIGCFLMWIIVFPWYLVTRGRIKQGKMPLKVAPGGWDQGRVEYPATRTPEQPSWQSPEPREPWQAPQDPPAMHAPDASPTPPAERPAEHPADDTPERRG